MQMIWDALKTMVLTSLAPVAVVLLVEHILMKYLYGKTSAIQRLTIGISPSSITDLVISLTAWIPIGILVRVLNFLTLPGIALTATVWLNKQTGWQGIWGAYLPQNFFLLLLCWYLVFDLAHYIAHVLMHRIPFFWRFHKLHHAATEMTIVNGTRVSYAERAFNQLFSFGLLTIVCGIPSPKLILTLVLTRQAIELLQHSDLPWDYGIVGWVIAGPRFHRMHHSSDPQDYNANYGNIFTFWDWLFGTVSTRYEEHGSAVADQVELGLDSKQETQRYNRWYYALINETWIEYAWIGARKLFARRDSK